MKLRVFVLGALLAIVPAVSMAVPQVMPGGPAGYGQHAYQQGPAAVLKRGLGSLMAFLSRNERPSERQLALFLDHEIAPYFDFAYMARWVGGPRWQRMSSEQKQALEAGLKREFLEALTQKLANYSGQRTQILRARRGHNGIVTVGLAILNPQGYPARMDFKFYRGRDGWKVFDVSANGSSAMVYYRQHFNRISRSPSHRAYR